MITKNDELRAVYSSDLDAFLTTLGKKAQFIGASLHCMYCNAVITESNLYAIVPVEDNVQFCCNKPECIVSLIEEAQK